MIGAPNSLNLNCKVRVMKEAPGPSVSEEIADIFTNYNIDLNNQYIILKTWNINSKFTDRAQCRVFPYAFELIEAYGPDSRHVSWKRPHGVSALLDTPLSHCACVTP